MGIELKRLREMSAGKTHFFDADSMRFFASRVAPGLTEIDGKVFFVTSEQCRHTNEPRLYTVRCLNIANGDVSEPPGEKFQGHKSLRSARKALATAAAVKSWKSEVIADSSGQWCGNALRFATEDEAKRYVRDLEWRWTLVRDTRVVQSVDPVTHTADERGKASECTQSM